MTCKAKWADVSILLHPLAAYLLSLSSATPAAGWERCLHLYDHVSHTSQQHIDGLQHKGTMSTKPVFEKIANIQRLYVPLCGHVLWILLTKITIFCNDVNKTCTSVELLAINNLSYMSKRSSVGQFIKSTAGLESFVEEWNGHNTFVHFYNELKFHILSRDGAMLGLSSDIRILTIDMAMTWQYVGQLVLTNG